MTSATSSHCRFAEALAIGNANVGEIDFVEVGAARHLVDGANLNTRRLHVDDEHGEALVLFLLGIGAHEDDTIVGIVRAGGPHFLTVDDPVVAIAHGFGLETGDVRTSARLGEQLAPDFLATQGRADIALDPLRRMEGNDGGDAHAEADAKRRDRRLKFLFLLAEDHLENWRQFAPTHVLAPCQTDIASGRLLGLIVF